MRSEPNKVARFKPHPLLEAIGPASARGSESPHGDGNAPLHRSKVHQIVHRLGHAERRHCHLEFDMRHSAMGTALLLTLLPLSALAQATPPPPAAASSVPAPAVREARAKMRAACATDVQKFCADVERGKGGLRECLRSHRAELSSECLSARASLRTLQAADRAQAKN